MREKRRGRKQQTSQPKPALANRGCPKHTFYSRSKLPRGITMGFAVDIWIRHGLKLREGICPGQKIDH